MSDFDYWMSTNSNIHIFRKPKFYETDENEIYLRDNSFIDAAQLAKDLKLHEHTIKAYQRRLGLRRFMPNDKKPRPEDW
jgi:hypothetical protein